MSENVSPTSDTPTDSRVSPTPVLSPALPPGQSPNDLPISSSQPTAPPPPPLSYPISSLPALPYFAPPYSSVSPSPFSYLNHQVPPPHLFPHYQVPYTLPSYFPSPFPVHQSAQVVPQRQSTSAFCPSSSVLSLVTQSLSSPLGMQTNAFNPASVTQTASHAPAVPLNASDTPLGPITSVSNVSIPSFTPALQKPFVNPVSLNNDENVNPLDNIPPEIRAFPKKQSFELDMQRISTLVRRISATPAECEQARPLICQDITNTNADTLRISSLPNGTTYERISQIVEPFGEIEDLSWSSSDHSECHVTYTDASAAFEAQHFLDEALVGSDSGQPLKAELCSRDPAAQLFVGDLTPDVTEELLEDAFSELVDEPVTALLKRDPESSSPIGYGFLTFKSLASANFALVAGHRLNVGNACIRVGRAERNTFLYVPDLPLNIKMEELKELFGQYGSLVDDDTIIVHRSYAVVQYKCRSSAERARLVLNSTDLKGHTLVRDSHSQTMKPCITVHFHSSVPRPPNSLRDLLTATFSKYGNCSVEVPRLGNNNWRHLAFVTFHGEPTGANLAAMEAVQSVRFVSSLPVWCQFTQEHIPHFPSGLFGTDRTNIIRNGSEKQSNGAFKFRGFGTRKQTGRRTEQGENNRSWLTHREIRKPFEKDTTNGQGASRIPPDFVPMYVPRAALHPSSHQMLSVHNSGIVNQDGSYTSYDWQNGFIIAENNAHSAGFNPVATCNNMEPFGNAENTHLQ